VPRVLKNISPDVFVSTDGFLPLNVSIPTVNVIHDLNFEHNPEHVPWLVRWFYKKYFPLYARKATRIATVSEFSKHDIATTYGIDVHSIDVVFNGVSSEFEPLTEVQKTIVKKTYTDGCDYFVYVGSLHPRKNIERLFAAFELCKKQTQTSCKLVIVGEAMFLSKSIQKAYNSNAYKNDIIFTGRVPSHQLGLIVGAAYTMTYVPLFEGFGIPILEAFACNIPVITSRCTSMPEVAGNAALYCDPLHTESIAVAMKKILNDKELYQKLLEYAYIQKQKFSWDKTADLVWKSILKVV
jgi:glycosyltransferase involved in cell wall biosynthesis